jgi:putative acetyltransferase
VKELELLIRKESEKDFREVEELTREAFWNVHVPGCNEHFLAHLLRKHEDFLPDLDFVAISEGRIVGNIMYAKSKLVNEKGDILNTITFGPISVLPEFQRKGVGSKLIQHTIQIAKSLSYKAIIIEGHPYNYCKHGFVGSKSLNISDSNGKYPYSLLCLELEKDFLKSLLWKYIPSNAYNQIDENEFMKYDKSFVTKEKFYKPTQEEFNIASRAFIE